MRPRATTCLLLGLWAAAAAGGAIERLETAHGRGRYTVSFEVLLDAPRDRVWDIMTDYERLPRVSKIIVASRVLKREDDNRRRVGLTLKACVLFFCNTVNRVMNVAARPKTEIVVTDDPVEGHFRYAVEHWRMDAEGAGTRLNYSAVVEPDFFVPPLIGPPVVKYFLRREIRITTLEVEALARHE